MKPKAERRKNKHLWFPCCQKQWNWLAALGSNRKKIKAKKEIQKKEKKRNQPKA
jgi:hypothetical protein